MTMKKAAFILILLLTALLRPALADTQEMFLKKQALTHAHREMFATGDFAKLDQSLNRIQQEYEAGKWKDTDLNFIFYEPLQATDPAFETLYNKWVAAYPKSYAANYCRGKYFYNRALELLEAARKSVRITAISHLPRELAPQMKQLVALAVRDETAAAELAAKPLTAYADLVDLHTFFMAQPVNGRKILDMANKIAPGNTLARYRYMSAINAAGANLATLKELVDDARKNGAGGDDKDNAIFQFYDVRLLIEGRYDLLDREMNGYQQAYEKGQINDVTLSGYFEAISAANPDNAEKYNAWIKAYPRSYAARQARAKYSLNTAWLARGDDVSSKMTPQEVEGLHLYLKQAGDDAKAAASMTAKPIQSYDVTHSIATLGGSRETGETMLRLANTIDPQNSTVRLSHMFALQSRWGGSLEKMENFLTQAKAVGIDEDILRHLGRMVVEEKYWLAAHAEKEYPHLGEMVTGF
ncbi:MAG: DUF4034 domain-containing protein [Alphaproteobacteria bacterium]